MTQEKVPLSHPPPNFSALIPATLKLIAEIHPPPPQIPFSFLPPTPSHYTLSSSTPNPISSLLSLPLPPGYTRESLLSQCHSLDPTFPNELFDTTPSPPPPNPIFLDKPPDITPSPPSSDPLPQSPGRYSFSYLSDIHLCPYHPLIEPQWIFNIGRLRFSFSQTWSSSPHIFLQPIHYLSPRNFPNTSSSTDSKLTFSIIPSISVSSILFHHKTPHIIPPLQITILCTAIHIFLHCWITIVSVYFSPSLPIDFITFEALLPQLQPPFPDRRF